MWTFEETATLLNVVTVLRGVDSGLKKKVVSWSNVAGKVPGRSASQCRSRYRRLTESPCPSDVAKVRTYRQTCSRCGQLRFRHICTDSSPSYTVKPIEPLQLVLDRPIPEDITYTKTDPPQYIGAWSFAPNSDVDHRAFVCSEL